MQISTFQPTQPTHSKLSSVPLTMARRWSDLGLVLLVAFGLPIGASIFRLLFPWDLRYTNLRLAFAILQELLALALFAFLYRKQGRSILSLGLAFHWTDVPKAFGLAVAAFVNMWFAYYALAVAWIAITHKPPHMVDTSARFTASSLWLLIPFLILNPLFEETLVRGYLTTELSQLGYSVRVASLLSLAVQTSYHLYYGVFGAFLVASGLFILVFYYSKSRRLWPVIGAHLLWDLTALLHAWHR